MSGPRITYTTAIIWAAARAMSMAGRTRAHTAAAAATARAARSATAAPCASAGSSGRRLGRPARMRPAPRRCPCHSSYLAVRTGNASSICWRRVDCQPMSRWSIPAISMTGRRPGVTSRGSHAHPSRAETSSMTGGCRGSRPQRCASEGIPPTGCPTCRPGAGHGWTRPRVVVFVVCMSHETWAPGCESVGWLIGFVAPPIGHGPEIGADRRVRVRGHPYE